MTQAAEMSDGHDETAGWVALMPSNASLSSDFAIW
jgi:hypothetical protein